MGVPARGRDGFGSSGSDDIRFRSRPESFFASYVADTGEIDAAQSLIIGGQLAWVRGRLSLQGEYLQAFVLRDRLDDVTFGGLYDVRGGRASVIMSGLNWYLNRYVRLQCNVGYASASGGPGADDGMVLQTRIDLLI